MSASNIPFKEINSEYLAGVDTVQYSELPPVKICPHILDIVALEIRDALMLPAPFNYIREKINKHILWSLSNKMIHSGRAINKKFFGQNMWTEDALFQYLHNKTIKGSNEKGLELEHNNERIYYTDQLQALDLEQPNLLDRVKRILSSSTFTVVTPELHKSLPNGITDPNDPFKRYRVLNPTLYWIDWNKESQWKITRIRKIIY